ncbi:MAG: SulP family inorganic anion transporter [Myxococcota bacterium]
MASGLRKNLKYDLPAGVVVFVVALPLCLGIAFASGNVDGEQLVPPLAGIVTGIVGGILVAWLSGSHTSVSGPAAGLIVMVVEAVRAYGYEGLLLVTVLAGAIQLLFGVLRFGRFGQLFPDAVVKAMLAAIGIILILKQVPHAVGFDGDYEGDMAFTQVDGRNTLTEIPFALGHMHLGALLVAAAGIGVIVLRERWAWLKSKNWLPGPLLVVVLGVLLNEAFSAFAPSLALAGDFLVRLPTGGIEAITRELRSPNWALISSYSLWITAVGIAIVASLETLLCADAVDGIDPLKRTTPPSRELMAQGVGNMVSGMLGGIPMTAVVVRGSANVQSGARSRVSSFLHGCFLLIAVFTGAKLMNRVPLAALAAILLHIGYRLANPKSLRAMAKRAPDHWIPFFATIAAILFTDLLTGIAIGFVLSVVFIALRTSRLKAPEDGHARLRIGPIVPPLSRFLIRRSVGKLQASTLVVDAADSDPLDAQTRDALSELIREGKDRGLHIELIDAEAVPA